MRTGVRHLHFGRNQALFLLACFLLVACNAFAAATPDSLPHQTLTAIPVPWTDTPGLSVTSEETTSVVFSYIHEASDSRNRINKRVGSSAEIVLESAPIIYGISRRDDGSVAGTSMLPWESHNVSDMQICFSLDAPCQLTGQWIPFELSSNGGLFGRVSIQKFKFPVDWVGPRIVWVVGQFRDVNGKPVLSVGDSYKDPEVISQTSIEIIGVWDETTPIEGQPAAVQTAIAATKAAFPLTGSVQIAGGGCCVGGIAGDILEVQVDFSAASPFGTVAEMRVRTVGICSPESEMVNAFWEPFVPSQRYPVYVALNWVGFYVSVQYRDDHGNLSPVYCDDISVEGFPPALATTSTP
jgi:uncharacterized Zn-binding protein involved in type VI secretion